MHVRFQCNSLHGEFFSFTVTPCFLLFPFIQEHFCFIICSPNEVYYCLNILFKQTVQLLHIKSFLSANHWRAFTAATGIVDIIRLVTFCDKHACLIKSGVHQDIQITLKKECDKNMQPQVNWLDKEEQIIIKKKKSPSNLPPYAHTVRTAIWAYIINVLINYLIMP